MAILLNLVKLSGHLVSNGTFEMQVVMKRSHGKSSTSEILDCKIHCRLYMQEQSAIA